MPTTDDSPPISWARIFQYCLTTADAVASYARLAVANTWSGLQTFSAGIKLGSSAGTFDYYETGSLAISIKATTTNPTLSSGTISGTYVRIGKMCHCAVLLNGVTFTGGSGNLYVGDLPFPCRAGYYGGNIVGLDTGNVLQRLVFAPQIPYFTSNLSGSSVAVSALVPGQTAYFSFCYEVA